MFSVPEHIPSGGELSIGLIVAIVIAAVLVLIGAAIVRMMVIRRKGSGAKPEIVIEENLPTTEAVTLVAVRRNNWRTESEMAFKKNFQRQKKDIKWA